MISTVFTAVISFVSTNIDDIFILVLFFSQINNQIKRWHIIIGQYLGIGVISIISIIGALGISVIPHEYVGLLGIVPIYLGIKAYVDQKKENDNNQNIVLERFQNTENSISEDITNTQGKDITTLAKEGISLNIVKVLSVTLANGGDNIGIYIPLFTNLSLIDILVTVIIFMVLIAFWCFLAIKITEYPFVHRNIEKYKNKLIPIIFIGLGLFILMESGVISFIFNKGV